MSAAGAKAVVVIPEAEVPVAVLALVACCPCKFPSPWARRSRLRSALVAAMLVQQVPPALLVRRAARPRSQVLW